MLFFKLCVIMGMPENTRFLASIDLVLAQSLDDAPALVSIGSGSHVCLGTKITVCHRFRSPGIFCIVYNNE